MFPSKNSNNTMTAGEEYRAKMKAMFTQTMKSELEKREKLKETQAAANDHGPTHSKRANFIRNQEAQKNGASPGAKKRLSEEEYAEIKRRRKENDLLRKEWPRVFVNEQGKMSSLSVEGERVPLFMGDIQSLLLFSLLGNKSLVMPRWARCINVTNVKNVVMVHIEGVGLSDVRLKTPPPPGDNTNNETTDTCKMEATENKEGSGNVGQNPVCSSGGIPEWMKNSLPRTSSVLHHSLEVVAPSTHGTCPVEELLELKTEKNTKRVFEEELEKQEKGHEPNKKIKPSASFFRRLSSIPPNPSDTLHSNDNYSRLKLLLKPGDLAKNSFPLPLLGYLGSTNSEFVLTSDNYKEVTSQSPMFGLDCEMCLTSIQKLELTRISVVNEKHEVVYHTLVLPYNPIVNFLTKFSGITPKMLFNVVKRLEDVQEDLRRLLPPDAILVGHSLDSDLTALKMMHPYVIDSSLAYNLTGRRTKRSSLKNLTEIFLNERIQIRGEGGHDPTEDAIATLKLIQWKLRNDEAYGNVMLGWRPPSAALDDWQEVKPDIEGQQQQPKEDSKQGTADQQLQQNDNVLSEESAGPFIRKDLSIFQHLQKMESVSTAIITTSQCLKSYLGVLASLNTMPTVEALPGHKQVSWRATDFTANTKLTYVHIEMGKKLQQCHNEATWQKQLTKLDKRMQRIYESAPPKSIHIYLFSGSSLNVPLRERSNGFVMVGIKDLPFRT
ncbi:uncharacterized protein LOC127003312 isoform X1 [Eriocheir sinensis]|uniref:uncharacterized protein LOC127003312 isoform X1 n=1 Tax=Eriocheir sinensis TaxID=95602 RepID=UPI0021C60501|nr:uncharacterized protein LOC127003312 isoform X1 [Eriocheir sinensis]